MLTTMGYSAASKDSNMMDPSPFLNKKQTVEYAPRSENIAEKTPAGRTQWARQGRFLRLCPFA